MNAPKASNAPRNDARENAALTGSARVSEAAAAGVGTSAGAGVGTGEAGARTPEDPGCAPGSGVRMKRENTLVKSFSYAASGVRQAATEGNFKVDLCAAVVALVLCAVLQVPAWGWAAVVLCIGAVLAAEAVNTAVEAVVDLASPEIHPLAKRAKDTAAAAALILALASVVVACIVYIPALVALMGIA